MEQNHTSPSPHSPRKHVLVLGVGCFCGVQSRPPALLTREGMAYVAWRNDPMTSDMLLRGKSRNYWPCHMFVSCCEHLLE